MRHSEESAAGLLGRGECPRCGKRITVGQSIVYCIVFGPVDWPESDTCRTCGCAWSVYYRLRAFVIYVISCLLIALVVLLVWRFDWPSVFVVVGAALFLPAPVILSERLVRIEVDRSRPDDWDR